MTVGTLLDRVRGAYLDRLRSAIEAARADDAAQVIAEPMFVDRDGSPVRDGALRLPTRGDLVVVRSGQAQELVRVDSEGVLRFDAVRLAWTGGLTVTMSSFPWDYLQAEIDRLDETAPLSKWFERWCDLDDQWAPGPDGLQGVVHFMSDPARHDRSWRVLVDFGSAPVEAFEEFLDAVAAAGARTARLGSAE